MKTIKKICLMLVILITTQLSAQEKTVTGMVTDATGPLPGATVIVKGTTFRTATDVDGKFSIKAKTGQVLLVTFIGYNDSEVTIGKANSYNIKLVESSVKLEEVLVTSALGIKKRPDAVTSSNQVMKSTEYYQAASPNAVQALKGKVAGLNINTANSNANSTTRVIIRGNRSITQNNQALVVINGVNSTAEVLAGMDPNSIDTVNVLKGAQGNALSSADGTNGVMVVTTKNGFSTINEVDKTLKPKSTKIEIDQEEYDNFIENQFESPKFSSLSTFSIDVDNAAYTNVRRFINNGQTVPKDAVRVEEMVNFFKYNYAKPQNEQPFSINTEYSDCPWNSKNKLVRIGLQGKEIDDKNLPASNLVFLIDVSGSMSDINKLPLLKQSLKILVDKLRKKDKIAMVVYAGAAGLVLPSTSGDDKIKIIDALDELNAGGSTAGGAGIELAYKIAQENFIKEGNNRVILATDGDFNVGATSNAAMETLIEDKRKSGVFLTCLGYGMGNYKDNKMEILADKGNGNYAYIDNIQEANRFLGKEFKGSMYAIAKDVKIQIEFNPTQVQSYRLIGYENRKLRAEDFKNDTIDAGELGSGHTVTALYEITPIAVENKFYEEPSDLKYTKTEVTGTVYQDELATIKFRYKKPDGEKSIEMVETIANKSNNMEIASADFKFSSAVAWFGLKLRNSKLITNSSSKDIIALANQGLGNDVDGYRKEFIRLVENVE